METSLKSLFISILSLMMIAVTTVQGDYHIGWVLTMYSANPNNYLATDSTCCEATCSPCSPVLRLCFCESGQSWEDTETCTLGSYVRNNPSFFIQNAAGTPRIPNLFTGSFQVYIRVAHDGSVPRMFDQNDPLIDNIFFEFTGVPATGQVVNIEGTGDFNRSTIELSVNVVCAQGYNGTDCNTFCEEINGTLTCSEEDIPTTPSIVTTDDVDLTSTSSSQTSSSQDDSTTVPTSGLINERSDNTLAIAVGVGVGGAVVLLLVVGGIILTVLLVIRIRQSTQKTAFYTVRRTETSNSDSANGDKYARSDNDDAQANNDPTDVENLYSTVNKKSKAPPLPPAYVPDAHEYQNLKSGQGHQGVVYANTSANGEQKQESVHLKYADVADSTPTSHINPDAASDGNESVHYSELRQE